MRLTIFGLPRMGRWSLSCTTLYARRMDLGEAHDRRHCWVTGAGLLPAHYARAPKSGARLNRVYLARVTEALRSDMSRLFLANARARRLACATNSLPARRLLDTSLSKLIILRRRHSIAT